MTQWYALPARSRIRPLVGIALAAFGMRALLVTSIVVYERCDFDRFVRSADGPQMLAMAEGWGGDLAAVESQTFFRSMRERGPTSSSHLIRFLPAISGTVALFRAVGLSEGLAGTLPFWLLAALGAALAAMWAEDLRVGLAVATLPPIQVYASSFLAHEPWFFVASGAALVFANRSRWVLAGLACGLALWSRPEAVFLGVGLGAAAAIRGTRREVAGFAGAAALAAAAGVVLIALRFGSVLGQLFMSSPSASPMGRSGGFLDWPGAALVVGVLHPQTTAWKTPYVLAHVLIALVAAAAFVAATIRRQVAPSRDIACAIWAPAHLLFVLSLARSQGFDDLPRYLGLATPAFAYAGARWLPRQAWVWVAIALASFAVAWIPAAKNTRPQCPASDSVAGASEPRSERGYDSDFGAKSSVGNGFGGV